MYNTRMHRLNTVPFALMGVLNVTPDSFSDGGLYADCDAAAARAAELAAGGAAIIDIGGESTRPGAEPVSAEEELCRVVPVVERVTAAGPLVSIDTMKLAVAEACLDAGAAMINDVSAFRAEPDLAGLVADRGAYCCLMHMRGTPRMMQSDIHYQDVVSEVTAFLEARLDFAVSQGVAEDRVLLDPGIGFGKAVMHNVELLRRLDQIVALGRPVVIGTSRKSFLGSLTGRATAERLAGTISSNVLAFDRGASVFRVHDVAPVRDALEVALAVASASSAPCSYEVAA